MKGSVPASAVEVRHQGAVLGALSVRMPANDPMNPSKERLIQDLAGQAGLVLRNAALIEDLRASRQRLVSAQDAERRRIERNIHDGAQQQLVALAVKLRLADALVGKDEERAHALLGELHDETSQALEDLRDLARGIYPPLLADKGLAVALEGQARKSAVPVTVASDGIGRYPQAVESAVYFSCLEALQNIAKYADASSATIRLERSNGSLTFDVTDDGVGFDPGAAGRGTGLQGIADRLAAWVARSRSGRLPARGRPSRPPPCGHRMSARTARILAITIVILSLVSVIASIPLTLTSKSRIEPGQIVVVGDRSSARTQETIEQLRAEQEARRPPDRNDGRSHLLDWGHRPRPARLAQRRCVDRVASAEELGGLVLP